MAAGGGDESALLHVLALAHEMLGRTRKASKLLRRAAAVPYARFQARVQRRWGWLLHAHEVRALTNAHRTMPRSLSL